MPIIQGGSQAIMDTYTKNQPNLAALSGQLSGMIPKLSDTSMLQSGTGYINDSLSGKYLNSNPANSYLTQQADGKYLNANPYTTAMGQQVGGDAFNRVNSTFSTSGRTGSYGNKEAAAEGYSQAALPVMYQNYQNERGLQNQAIGMLGQNYNTALGIQGQAAAMLPSYQQAQTGANTAALGGIQLAGQLPYYGSNSLGNIGSLLGNYGTSSTTGTKPGGWGNDILGAAMAAAPFVLSDRRLKKNIMKVGEAKDGLGIYEFVYKFDTDNIVNRGVMADEVERLRPQAFIPNLRGDYAGVNYAALGSLA